MKQHGTEAPKAALPQGQPSISGWRQSIWFLAYLDSRAGCRKICSATDTDFDTMLQCSGTIIRRAAFQTITSLQRQEVTMIAASHPIYVARRQNDGTWSIIDIKSGRVANIGGCVLGRLDAAMAAGLVQDLNKTATEEYHQVSRHQS